MGVCVCESVCARSKGLYKKKILLKRKGIKKKEGGGHSLMEVLHARTLALSEAPPEAGMHTLGLPTWVVSLLW